MSFKPNSPICFTHLIEKSNEFIAKFDALCHINMLNKNKLGVYQNKLYVSWSVFQGLQRTLYRESREKLIIFLEENFTNYKYFFLKLLDLLVKDDATPGLANIIHEHSRLWTKWINGLSSLSVVYSDDFDFVERLKKNVLDVFNVLYRKKTHDSGRF
jgi:hypothetical protein